ncbi:hypothetical protein [Paenibacillus polymyxa]|uniref:Uncharacterized protein n=1 Tax=Paenibacillus polymyxa (strain SC2) TaxID=886882 RepID=E3EKS6_PAEPS|nr:hypothetical protein [Paenibacillus polymyxa]ADO59527.1 hypothetical protein PPSC2_27460 [Paenibacillus polymyxa SC2]WPQ59640.1 hypothetical protein SKN87_28680 [Paenibacillus polymyxa]
MKPKILIGLMGVGIVVGLSISLYLSFSEKQDPTQSAQETQQPKTTTAAVNPDLKDSHSDVQKKPLKGSDKSIYEKPPEQKRRSIQSLEAEPLEQEARQDFRNLKFMNGVEKLQSIVNEVEDKDEGAMLHQLYFEGSMLANLIPPSEEDEISGDHGETIEFDGMVGILSMIKDPENALLGTLALNDRYRAEIILEQDSLNPIFDGGVRILQLSKETEGKIFEDVFNMYKSAKTLYKIDFEIEGHHLVGYVIQFADGTSKLYSILPADGAKPPYKSIREWQKIYKIIENR